MSLNLEVIGGVELVNFPKAKLWDVPARIDTGARTSAIWASNISVDGTGRLSFRLFDEASPYYQNREISVKSYDRIIVTSSNGVSEKRYRVKLLVEVRGRRIRASFTLSDRSAQTYPVLIGRSALRGKFIVDVKKETKPAVKKLPAAGT